MRRSLTVLTLGVATIALAGPALDARTAAGPACDSNRATLEYTNYVQGAVDSGPDRWGLDLLAARGGPTYRGAQGRLAPLLFGVQRGLRPLTATGFYYVPLSFSWSNYGSTVFALHVADGSEVITRHVGGPALGIYVGNGGERYGSCVERLRPARLAGGHLPLIETSYTDGYGVRYRQESFVGHVFGVYGVRSIISFIRLDVDARNARASAHVRFDPTRWLGRTGPERSGTRAGVRLIVSPGGQFVRGGFRFVVEPGTTTTLYADWLNAPSPARAVKADAATYDTARRADVRHWTSRLAEGARFEVPEPAVQDAQLGVLGQALSYGWRYSVGNPYEELSFAEALDSAEVTAAYGYPAIAKQILEVALRRLREKPYRLTAWRAGHVLATAATYYDLTRDREFVRRETPELARVMAGIAARRTANGRLRPEPISSDALYSIDGVAAQVAAWYGLLAADRLWSVTGHRDLAARARQLALSLEAKLRPAVRRAQKRLGDGSLYVPSSLAHDTGPYDRLTTERDGSYWNLVMPYAFATGYFPPHSAAAKGIVRYLLAHGSRLLGVTRSDAHIVYANKPYGSGLGQVYGLSMSRFLADNGQYDQLVLSLYGMLAIGMTQGTYISGEAISVVPVDGTYYRRMYMPPNSGADASFLETLRLLLVHERRGPKGAPAGLDLAFATPRAWLASGKTISVDQAPTSFGKVSYSIARTGNSVAVSLVLPPRANARLRLRLPAGETIGGTSVGTLHRTTSTIDLRGRQGTLELRATVRR
ncbi:MAG: hypothetical protein ACJ76I_07205 [Gaiellaceae bacterium]